MTTFDPQSLENVQLERDGFVAVVRVNRPAKLNALDEQSYLGLRKAGAIGLAYGQIVSMSRLEMLGRLAEHHENVVKARQQARPLPELNELFANDDKLMF